MFFFYICAYCVYLRVSGNFMKKLKPEKDKNKKLWKVFYGLLFFIGLLLIVLEINLYRKTIIELYIPISIILATGFISFIISKNHFKHMYSFNGNFYPLIQNICSWGFIFCYLFMASNFYLSENKITEYQFQIKEKSSMPGRKYHRNERQPLVRIDYFNFEKELVFRFTDTDIVMKADSVNLKIKKGGLGFDILKEYNVISSKN